MIPQVRRAGISLARQAPCPHFKRAGQDGPFSVSIALEKEEPLVVALRQHSREVAWTNQNFAHLPPIGVVRNE